MKRLLPALLGLLCAFALTLPSALAALPNGELSAARYDPQADAYLPLTGPVVALTLDGAPLADDVPAVLWQGRTLVPVRLVGEALGIQVTWSDPQRQVTLTQGEHTVTLTLDSPTALVDGAPTPLPGGVPPTLLKVGEQARTMVPLRFVSETLGCTVTWDAASCTAHILSPTARPIVVLDPGHGGSASGAWYEGVAEKAVNLTVARRTEELLTAAGVRVVMTRTGDTQLGLYQRAGLANGLGANLFLSIHANASQTHLQARGIETYFFPGSVSGGRLAAAVQAAAVAATGAADRGTPTANFVVLRETRMPAALVEMGFLSTPAERVLLSDPAYQAKLAQGIARGVLDFLGL